MNYQIGTHRPMVMGIQTILNIDPDGFFGPATDKAVRQYQELYDLDVDGVVGLDLRAQSLCQRQTGHR